MVSTIMKKNAAPMVISTMDDLAYGNVVRRRNNIGRGTVKKRQRSRDDSRDDDLGISHPFVAFTASDRLPRPSSTLTISSGSSDYESSWAGSSTDDSISHRDSLVMRQALSMENLVNDNPISSPVYENWNSSSRSRRRRRRRQRDDDSRQSAIPRSLLRLLSNPEQRDDRSVESSSPTPFVSKTIAASVASIPQHPTTEHRIVGSSRVSAQTTRIQPTSQATAVKPPPIEYRPTVSTATLSSLSRTATAKRTSNESAILRVAQPPTSISRTKPTSAMTPKRTTSIEHTGSVEEPPTSLSPTVKAKTISKRSVVLGVTPSQTSISKIEPRGSRISQKETTIRPPNDHTEIVTRTTSSFPATTTQTEIISNGSVVLGVTPTWPSASSISSIEPGGSRISPKGTLIKPPNDHTEIVTRTTSSFSATTTQTEIISNGSVVLGVTPTWASKSSISSIEPRGSRISPKGTVVRPPNDHTKVVTRTTSSFSATTTTQTEIISNGSVVLGVTPTWPPTSRKSTEPPGTWQRVSALEPVATPSVTGRAPLSTTTTRVSTGEPSAKSSVVVAKLEPSLRRSMSTAIRLPSPAAETSRDPPRFVSKTREAPSKVTSIQSVVTHNLASSPVSHSSSPTFDAISVSKGYQIINLIEPSPSPQLNGSGFAILHHISMFNLDSSLLMETFKVAHSASAMSITTPFCVQPSVESRFNYTSRSIGQPTLSPRTSARLSDMIETACEVGFFNSYASEDYAPKLLELEDAPKLLELEDTPKMLELEDAPKLLELKDEPPVKPEKEQHIPIEEKSNSGDSEEDIIDAVLSDFPFKVLDAAAERNHAVERPICPSIRELVEESYFGHLIHSELEPIEEETWEEIRAESSVDEQCSETADVPRAAIADRPCEVSQNIQSAVSLESVCQSADDPADELVLTLVIEDELVDEPREGCPEEEPEPFVDETLYEADRDTDSSRTISFAQSEETIEFSIDDNFYSTSSSSGELFSDLELQAVMHLTQAGSNASLLFPSISKVYSTPSVHTTSDSDDGLRDELGTLNVLEDSLRQELESAETMALMQRSPARVGTAADTTLQVAVPKKTVGYELRPDYLGGDTRDTHAKLLDSRGDSTRFREPETPQHAVSSPVKLAVSTHQPVGSAASMPSVTSPYTARPLARAVGDPSRFREPNTPQDSISSTGTVVGGAPDSRATQTFVASSRPGIRSPHTPSGRPLARAVGDPSRFRAPNTPQHSVSSTGTLAVGAADTFTRQPVASAAVSRPSLKSPRMASGRLKPNLKSPRTPSRHPLARAVGDPSRFREPNTPQGSVSSINTLVTPVSLKRTTERFGKEDVPVVETVDSVDSESALTIETGGYSETTTWSFLSGSMMSPSASSRRVRFSKQNEEYFFVAESQSGDSQAGIGAGIGKAMENFFSAFEELIEDMTSTCAGGAGESIFDSWQQSCSEAGIAASFTKTQERSTAGDMPATPLRGSSRRHSLLSPSVGPKRSTIHL